MSPEGRLKAMMTEPINKEASQESIKSLDSVQAAEQMIIKREAMINEMNRELKE